MWPSSATLIMGKATLLTSFSANGTFRDNQRVEERATDPNDLEKERGITIPPSALRGRLAGDADHIVDTPGQRRFGGEVERILSMVDGVIRARLAEGAMPQTQFVTGKALRSAWSLSSSSTRSIVPTLAHRKVLDEVFDLFVNLEAMTNSRLPAPLRRAQRVMPATIPMCARVTWISPFEKIVSHVPARRPRRGLGVLHLPRHAARPRQLPRPILTGRVASAPSEGQPGHSTYSTEMMARTRRGARASNDFPSAVSRVPRWKRPRRRDHSPAGITVAMVSDTIATPRFGCQAAADRSATLSMRFAVNDSPMAGREGDEGRPAA